MKLKITLTFLGGAIAGGLAAEPQLPWPRFRGPNGSGVAEGQKLPSEFGPEKNVRWKASVPPGLSSPIIAGDQLLITTFEGEKLYTVAYRRADGSEVWRAMAPTRRLEVFHRGEGSPAASTPATDGTRIVSYFGSCGLICYDLTGRELWRHELPPANTWGDYGTGVSPILVDGTVVLVRDQSSDAKILALDAATGARKWETSRVPRTSFCTPIEWNTGTGREIVASGHARMHGYDLKTGVAKWSFSGVPFGCCPSPVTDGGLLLFAGGRMGPDDQKFEMPSFDSMLGNLDKDHDGAIGRDEGEKSFEGFFDNQDQNKDGKITRDEWDRLTRFMSEGRNAAFALKPGGTGDITSSHLLWTRTKGLPYIASAIAYRGRFIMIKEGGIVTACDPKTGDQIYQERLGAPGQYFASPVAASGIVYFVSLADGIITAMEAGPDKPRVIMTSRLGEKTHATPAIADDTIYFRTASHLYAFGEAR